MALNSPPAGAPTPGLKLGAWRPGAAKSVVILIVVGVAVLELHLVSRFSLLWQLAWGITTGQDLPDQPRPVDTGN